MMRFVGRESAERLIMRSWAPAIEVAERVKLPFHLPDWDRMRNYEYERLLGQVLGGEWCISEWCPFDGIFCTWRQHAPAEVREAMARDFARRRAELTTNGYNVDYLIDCVRNP